MLHTILIVLLLVWVLGLFGPAAAPYRAWGGDVGYPSIGVVIVLLVALHLFGVF
jgi:hypothetical protein